MICSQAQNGLEHPNEEIFAMTRSVIDTSFPYVLVCSTLGAIVSLASVWLATSLSFAPVIGA